MKRRDWKIKKLKKDIYGKKTKKRRKVYLLRELKLRSYNVFLNKDLVPQYKFYKKLISFFRFKNKSITSIYFYNNFFKNYYVLFPNFFFKKKIFNFFNFFKDFLINNKFNYIFLKNLSRGNNVFLFNKDKENNDFSIKLFDDENISKVFTYKYILDKKSLHENNFNFFINFNFFMFNSLEIYKILIILYLNKLK